MIRFKFAVPLIITIGCICTGLFFAGTLFKNVIENQLSSQYGAQINVESVDISYFPLTVTISGLDVTDLKSPMTNVVSFEQIRASLSFLPLIEKKILIPELSVIDVSLNTPRSKSGRLVIQSSNEKDSKNKEDSPSVISKLKSKASETTVAKKVKKESQKKVEQFKKDALSFQTPDMGRPIELKSEKEAEKVKANISKVNLKWKERVDNSPVKSNALGLQQNWKRFRENYPKKIESVTQINDQIQSLNQLNKDSKVLLRSINNEKKEFNTDYKSLQKQIEQLSKYVQDDYKNASSQLKSDNYSFNNITELYLSEIVRQKVDPVTTKAKELYSLFRKLKGAGPPKAKTSWRHPGMMIDFSKDKVLPRVWIQQVLVSASSKSAKKVEGSIQNITSHQSVIGVPTVAVFKFQNITGDGHKGDLVLSYDSFSNPEDAFLIKSHLNGIRIQDKNVINSNSEKIDLSSGNIAILTEGSIKGETIDVRSTVDASSLRFSQSGVNTASFSLNNLIFMSLRSMKDLQIKARLKGSLDNWSLSLTSDLDKFDVKGLVNSKLDKKKAALKKQLDQRFSNSKSKLMSQVSSDNKSISKIMNAYHDGGKSVQKQIDSRLNAEKNKFKNKQDELKRQANAKIEAEKEKAKAKIEAEKQKAKKEAEAKLKKEAKSLLKGLKF